VVNAQNAEALPEELPHSSMPPSRDSPEELDQRDDGDRAFLESLFILLNKVVSARANSIPVVFRRESEILE
ncbi:MAG: hypothetical protein QXT50_03180, partial [Thermofilum sp.]